jgi:drug/metabolite transporter (DMT)-like permease
VLDAPPHADGLLRLELFGRSVAFPGRYLLYGVPFLWGTFGPAVRVLFAVEPHPVPSLFNTERLLLSNAVYLPILVGELAAVRKRVTGAASPTGRDAGMAASSDSPSAENYDDPYLSLKAGLELGAWVFLANVAQVLGLEATSAGRAAFLVQLQTVFIPVMTGLFGINRVGRNTWISSLIAISGVALLSLDKGHGTQSSVLGDSLEVLSAVFFSIYVIRLGGYCNRVPSGPLIAVKITVQAALSTLWALGMEAYTLTAHPVMHNPDGPASWTAHAIFINVAVIAWTGIMSSAVSGWLQTKGQQFVPASESAVIFATQPLWASATAAVVLGETFGPRGVGGGALIVLATIFASMSEAKKKEQELAPLEVEGVSSAKKSE